jgi:hypothetical protein
MAHSESFVSSVALLGNGSSASVLAAWRLSHNSGLRVLATCELHSLTAVSSVYCSAHGLLARAQDLLPADPLHQDSKQTHLKTPHPMVLLLLHDLTRFRGEVVYPAVA